MNKKWLVGYKNTFSIRLCEPKIIFELLKLKSQIFMFPTIFSDDLAEEPYSRSGEGGAEQKAHLILWKW